MVIESTLSRASYIKFSFLSILRSRFFYIFSATIFLPPLMLYQLGIATFSFSARLVLAALASYLLMWSVIVFYGIAATMNKRYVLQARFTLNSEAITEETEMHKTEYRWHVFTKWSLIGDAYVLYMTTPRALLISRTSILPEERVRFESILNSNIKMRKPGA